MKSHLTFDNPSWGKLSTAQRIYVANGCGAKGGWLNPPGFMFTASCDQHDFYYWRGANEDDRKDADDAFLRAMLRDASTGSWWLRWFHRSMARTYHWAVRKWGAPHFKTREEPATWTTLFVEMRTAGLDPLEGFDATP